MYTWMIPDDPLLAAAREAEAHRAGNSMVNIIYPLVWNIFCSGIHSDTWRTQLVYWVYINGLVQDCRIFIANAPELPQSYYKPLISCIHCCGIWSMVVCTQVESTCLFIFPGYVCARSLVGYIWSDSTLPRIHVTHQHSEFALNDHIGAKTKWLIFSRQHFLMHFIETNCCVFIKMFIQRNPIDISLILFYAMTWHPNWWLIIICTNHDLFADMNIFQQAWMS